MSTLPKIPHARIVVGASLLAVGGYAVFSAWAVFYSEDAGLRGDVIGTWKSFAVAAFTFWLGSSSGGKVPQEPPAPSGAADAARQTADAADGRAREIEDSAAPTSART